MIALGYTMIIKIKQINNLKNKIEMYKIEEIEHNKKLIEASKKEEELNDLRETNTKTKLANGKTNNHPRNPYS